MSLPKKNSFVIGPANIDQFRVEGQPLSREIYPYPEVINKIVKEVRAQILPAELQNLVDFLRGLPVDCDHLIELLTSLRTLKAEPVTDIIRFQLKNTSVSLTNISQPQVDTSLPLKSLVVTSEPQQLSGKEADQLVDLANTLKTLVALFRDHPDFTQLQSLKRLWREAYRDAKTAPDSLSFAHHAAAVMGFAESLFQEVGQSIPFCEDFSDAGAIKGFQTETGRIDIVNWISMRFYVLQRVLPCVVLFIILSLSAGIFIARQSELNRQQLQRTSEKFQETMAGEMKTLVGDIDQIYSCTSTKYDHSFGFHGLSNSPSPFLILDPEIADQQPSPKAKRPREYLSPFEKANQGFTEMKGSQVIERSPAVNRRPCLLSVLDHPDHPFALAMSFPKVETGTFVQDPFTRVYGPEAITMFAVEYEKGSLLVHVPTPDRLDTMPLKIRYGDSLSALELIFATGLKGLSLHSFKSGSTLPPDFELKSGISDPSRDFTSEHILGLVASCLNQLAPRYLPADIVWTGAVPDCADLFEPTPSGPRILVSQTFSDMLHRAFDSPSFVGRRNAIADFYSQLDLGVSRYDIDGLFTATDRFDRRDFRVLKVLSAFLPYDSSIVDKAFQVRPAVSSPPHQMQPFADLDGQRLSTLAAEAQKAGKASRCLIFQSTVKEGQPSFALDILGELSDAPSQSHQRLNLHNTHQTRFFHRHQSFPDDKVFRYETKDGILFECEFSFSGKTFPVYVMCDPVSKKTQVFSRDESQFLLPMATVVGAVHDAGISNEVTLVSSHSISVPSVQLSLMKLPGFRYEEFVLGEVLQSLRVSLRLKFFRKFTDENAYSIDKARAYAEVSQSIAPVYFVLEKGNMVSLDQLPRKNLHIDHDHSALTYFNSSGDFFSECYYKDKLMFIWTEKVRSANSAPQVDILTPLEGGRLALLGSLVFERNSSPGFLTTYIGKDGLSFPFQFRWDTPSSSEGPQSSSLSISGLAVLLQNFYSHKVFNRE